ncbi:hypothetical protein CARUB_v10019331mg [Capsella rubella]|uniref:Uncharacterized protein n=1 Tax=Capsella rubella TaxID=81985 RepID=R0H235_9BRAS|nr:uncharacterized protein LOC17886335 [Capsella rubella]EOA23329.1 hypothetical protein CARUB_v10019331mg [Capsella rubella]
MVPRILHEWLTYMVSKVSGKYRFRKSAEEQNIPIAATTLTSHGKPSLESRKLKGIRFTDSRGRVDFVFVDNEAQGITNESQEITNVSSTTSQELPSSSFSHATLTAHSNERSNSLRSIVIQ